MNDKINSALDGLKNMAKKAHLTDKIHDVGTKIKENLSDIDIKETLNEATDKLKNGSVSEAVNAVSDKIKNALTGDKKSIEEGLQDLPGAAINAADKNAVNPGLVKERTCALNNNPRNTDM